MLLILKASHMKKSVITTLLTLVVLTGQAKGIPGENGWQVLPSKAEWTKALNSSKKASSKQWCFPLPGAKVISPYGKRGKQRVTGFLFV